MTTKQTLITKIVLSTSCAQDSQWTKNGPKIFPVGAPAWADLPLKTIQHYSGWVGLSTESNITRLHKAQHCLGHDFLAINTMLKHGVFASIGRKIGIGKESGIFFLSCCSMQNLFFNYLLLLFLFKC